MNIKTETTVILTSEDVKDIIKEYLERRGYITAVFYPQLRTDYTDGYDTMEFNGFKINVTGTSDSPIKIK